MKQHIIRNSNRFKQQKFIWKCIIFSSFLSSNPNGVSKPQDSNLSAPYWSKYTRADKKYMQLDNTPQEAQNIKSEKVVFWNKLFSFWKLGKRRKEEL